MRHRAAITVASALALLPGVVAAPRAEAAVECRVEYTVLSQWQGGFHSTIVITNLGSPLRKWSLSFTFPGTQSVVHGWNGRYTTRSSTVTVANEAWNGAIPTDGTVAPGFLGTWEGDNTPPAAFTLNGRTCADATGQEAPGTTTDDATGTTTDDAPPPGP